MVVPGVEGDKVRTRGKYTSLAVEVVIDGDRAGLGIPGIADEEAMGDGH